jgi:hypothetical protein
MLVMFGAVQALRGAQNDLHVWASGRLGASKPNLLRHEYSYTI